MKAGFIANLRVGRKLLLLSGVFIAGFLAFGGYSWYTISRITINSPVYREIVLQKDLVADIMPPPENIMEAYLTALQLKDAKISSDVDVLTKRLAALEKDYRDRHEYWGSHLSAGPMRDKLIDESYNSAAQFFNIVDTQLIPAVQAGHADQADAIVGGTLGAGYENHRKSVDAVVSMADKESLRIENMASAVEARSMILLLGVAAVILVAIAILCIIIAVGISRPLRRSMEFAHAIADGDFTRQLPIQQKDEIGSLAGSLNDMSMKLRDMVANVQQSAVQVAASSQQITAGAERLAMGAQSQASTLEETSAAVEELSASVDQVSQHAQRQVSAVEEGSGSMIQVHRTIEEVSKNLSEISDLAQKSVENAMEGAKAVSEVVDGINLIASGSEKIGGIVSVISDIADQTNLLALNASIEAARAGEHGRGFGVVADEVSKLADRSSTSTKEIAGLIRESAKNVTRGVATAKGSQLAMEQIRAASQKVQEMIAALSQATGRQVAAVGELARALENVSEMSQSIRAATEEQTTNAKQVSKAVENVNEVTQSAATSAEEMSAATAQLSRMAQELQKLTTQFQIGNRKIPEAAGAPSAAALPAR